MSESQNGFVESIFHPSDFSEASERAFAHALAIALLRKTELAILHAGPATESDWSRFPAVRRTLERWKVLEPGSPRSAVFRELSVGVTKITSKGDPVRACLRYVAESEPDLIVLATEGRDGVTAWLRPSVAERVARRTRTMTLFVPSAGRGFISVEDGRIELRRILVPIDHAVDAAPAVLRATRAAAALGEEPVAIRLLHVGGALPAVERPEGEGWRYEEALAEGEVVDGILEQAESADLVVMATEGRHGFLDVFRGSVTERVVREARCPVLAVPA